MYNVKTSLNYTTFFYKANIFIMFSSNNSHKVSDNSASIKTFNHSAPVQLWKTTTLDGVNAKVITTTSSKINNLYIPNNIYYGGSLINSSDIRLKTNIEPINTFEANKILQLNPCKYKLNTRNNNNNEIHYGFIAQQVEQIIPNIVSQLPMTEDDCNMRHTINEEPLKGIDYNSLIPFLVSHAQILQGQINQLNKQVNELKLEISNSSLCSQTNKSSSTSNTSRKSRTYKMSRIRQFLFKCFYKNN
jgi:hypothetical protein